MRTPVTAADVTNGSDIWDGQNLCHITETHPTGASNGVYLGVHLQWTENIGNTEVMFSGTFGRDTHFGHTTSN